MVVGEVIELGSEVTKFQVGQLVCVGGMVSSSYQTLNSIVVRESSLTMAWTRTVGLLRAASSPS